MELYTSKNRTFLISFFSIEDEMWKSPFELKDLVDGGIMKMKKTNFKLEDLWFLTFIKISEGIYLGEHSKNIYLLIENSFYVVETRGRK